jgi:glycosyltransferase involved in cell wall biosynthesis
MSRAVSAVLLGPLLLAGVVIANSESTLAWIASSLGQRVLRRSRVVHNGVRSPSSAAAPLAEVVPGAKRLVVVGRLTPRKGQDLAISATALVRQAGFDARLTLVGDGYPGYEGLVAGLHALADSEGISDVTEFAGFQDPVPYLTAADLVLVPSRVESFGLVAAEALLLGRPVVAARIGGLPEVIRDGVTGVLVDPDDPQALADAVVALLSDPSAARALGDAGLADARERFSQETYAARLIEVVVPAA